MLFAKALTLLCLTLDATGQTTRRRTTADNAPATSAARTTARSSRTSSRMSSASTPTISSFVGTYSAGWKASVVAVSACDTTLQLECDGANNDLCRADAGIRVAANQKPNSYELAYTTSGTTITDRCALTASTQAVCTATVIPNGSGPVTNAPATNTSVVYARVPVTAGADMLSSAGASCRSSSNAAAPTATAPLGAGVVAALAM